MRIQSLIHLLIVVVSAHPPLALRAVWEELRRRWYSDELAYGFRFDLTHPFDIPEAEPPLNIRELSTKDIPILFNLKRPDISISEFRFIIISLMLIEARLPTCYVGVTKENYPYCICWLVHRSDYYNVHALFSNRSYLLQPDEVFFDNIYTRQDARGKRLMRFITLRLFEKAMQDGAKQAIAFISVENPSSLAGSNVIGWKPFTLKRVHWRFFKSFTSFEPAP